jgi:hypothetical protein
LAAEPDGGRLLEHRSAARVRRRRLTIDDDAMLFTAFPCERHWPVHWGSEYVTRNTG